MSNFKYIIGSFADPDELMDGIDRLQANNVSIYDCFTPMPIHGIEAKLGVKPSRLPIAAFCFGLLGGTLGFSLLYYTMFYDRSEEHTSELQSRENLVCRLLL